MRRGILISLFLVCALSTALLAANNPNAKMALHLRPHSAKAGCDYGTIEDCEDIVYELEDGSFDAFPVFFDLIEFLGCEYGLEWPETWSSASFTNCSDFVIGGVVNPGDGAAHTWTSCQPSGVCVPAFVWIVAYGPGQICPTDNPLTGFPKVLDCAQGADSLFTYGACAGLYGAEGDDPCELNPITPTTWGEIKSLFK
jgi:hypothetical protein